MCIARQHGEKRFFIQYRNQKEESVVVVKNFRGQHLWTSENLIYEGKVLQPTDLCTDNNGHVFAADPMNNRVFVMSEDPVAHLLIETTGPIGCIAWCDVRQQLHVVHGNREETAQVCARFTIS